MSILTLLKYLLGDRSAILTIATAPGALLCGLLFVLSAGLSREYDGKDLIAQPWHLLVPVGASLATSFVLFFILYLAARIRGIGKQPFFRMYHSFLTLYWMTAPLAWLYAIPVERFMSPGNAMRANLMLLGVVALWRVALMIRVAAVLFTANPRATLWPVMLFADSVVMFVLFLTPIPMLFMMGGIRLSEREQVLAATTFSLGLVSFLSWPVWALGSIGMLWGPKNWKYVLANACDAPRISRSLWLLGCVSIAVWIFILPFTQPEQRLRTAVEDDLASGRIKEAVHLMVTHRRDDLPPHWEPPPRFGYSEPAFPPILDVLEVVLDSAPPAWVLDVYTDNLREHMSNGMWLRDAIEEHEPRHAPSRRPNPCPWWALTDMDRLMKVLKRLPQGRAVVLANADRIAADSDRWGDLWPQCRTDANTLLEWAGYQRAPKSDNADTAK